MFDLIALFAATLTALAAQVGEPRTIDVTVVDERGEPVAGAEVRWFEGYDVRLTLDAIDDRAHASGNRAVADERGHATIAVASPDATFVASAPGLWGTRATWGSETKFPIELLPDDDLVVAVVDSEGKPLGGVPVALRCDAVVGAGSRSLRDVVEGVSDAGTGRAVLRHVGYARARQYATDSRNGLRSSWKVVIDTTPEQSPSWAPAADVWPAEVRLVVQNVADVEVQLLGAEEEKPLDGGRAFLIPRWPDYGWTDGWSPSRLERFRFPGEPLPLGVSTATVYEGRALFRHVGLDVPLGVVAFRNEASAPSVTWFTGPTEPGQHTKVRAELGANTCALRLRLVDAGVPVASTRITVTTTAEGYGFDSEEDILGLPDSRAQIVDSWVDTDATGVLRIDLDVPRNGWLNPMRLSAKLDGAREREAWIELQGLRIGPREQGEVAFPPAPLLVAGVVVDDAGEPISDAPVRLGFEEFRSTDFRPGALLERKTDALGAFAFHTALDARFVIDVDVAGHFPARAFPVARGTTDLRIVLRRPADVRGYLRVPPEREVRDFTILMLRTEGGVAPDVAPGTWIGCSCDGAFEFEGIKSGEYLLRVRERDANGKTRDLLDWPGIAVRGGETLDLGEIRIE